MTTNDDDLYRGLLEALKIQTTVNQGLQSQIEGLSRMIENLWGAVLMMAGDNPPPKVQALSEQARREIEELKKLYGDGGGEPR